MQRRTLRQSMAATPVAVLAAGSGGVEELRDRMDESSVSWALLRFQATPGQMKLVMVHCDGDDVPTVKRGRLNARTPEAVAIFGQVDATLTVKRKVDLTVQAVCTALMPTLSEDVLTKESLQDAYVQSVRRRSVRVAAKPPTARERRGPEPTAQDCLKAVGSLSGQYNWVLLEPTELSLFNAGIGGLEEMTELLQDDTVLFGVVRFSFGQNETQCGTGAEPGMVKHVFVHWVGPKVKVVMRGQYNAKAGDAEAEVRRVCTPIFRKEAHQREDLDLKEMVAEVQKTVIANKSPESVEGSIVSLEEYKRVLAREQALATSASQENEKKDGGEAGYPDTQKVVETVKSEHGRWDWALIGASGSIPAQPLQGTRASLAGAAAAKIAETAAAEKAAADKAAAERAAAEKAAAERTAAEAAEKAAAERAATEKEAAEKAAAEKEAAEKAAAEKATAEKAASEKAAAEKAAAEKAAAEKAAAENAAAEKAAAEKAAADAEKAAAEKAAIDKAAAEKEAADSAAAAKEAAEKAAAEKAAEEKATAEKAAAEKAAAEKAAAEKAAENAAAEKEAAAAAEKALAEKEATEKEAAAKEAAEKAAAEKAAAEKQTAEKAAAEKAAAEKEVVESTTAKDVPADESDEFSEEEDAPATKQCFSLAVPVPSGYIGDFEVTAAVEVSALGWFSTSTPPDKVSVVQVDEKGWAKKVGLRAGDVLVEIQGRPLHHIESKEEFVAAMKSRPLSMFFTRERGAEEKMQQRVSMSLSRKSQPIRASVMNKLNSRESVRQSVVERQVNEAGLGADMRTSRVMAAFQDWAEFGGELHVKMGLLQWKRRYFQLSQGHLRWWHSEKLFKTTPRPDPEMDLMLADVNSRWKVESLKGMRFELCYQQLLEKKQSEPETPRKSSWFRKSTKEVVVDEKARKEEERPAVERYNMSADSIEQATAWAKAIWHHSSYVDMLLHWPMPMEGRQGDVGFYGIEIPGLKT